MCAPRPALTTLHPTQRGLPEGMVVANDADTKRATTMAHQARVCFAVLADGT